MKSDQIKLLSDRDHILKRPNMYIGNTNTIEKLDWFLIDDNKKKMIYKEMWYNAAYYKLINEILDNAVDEYIKTNGKYSNKIKITLKEDLTFIIKDNGRGLPTLPFKIGQKPQAYIAFTNLRAGSNFNEERNSIGQNGVGASLTNVFSKYFYVKTSDENNCFIMTCENNMSNIKYNIKKKGRRGTEIKFKLDDSKFDSIENITYTDIYNMILKRILEIRLTYNINFTVNNKQIKENILDYMSESSGSLSKDNYQVSIYFIKDHKNISYVNSLYTYDGGTHENYIIYKITAKLRELIKKKFKYDMKPTQIQQNFYCCISMKIKNPEFDSQNKTLLINKDLNIDSNIIEKMVVKSFKRNIDYWKEILSEITNDAEEKNFKMMQKKQKKIIKDKIENYIDIEGRNYNNAILCIFEGLSAISNLMKVRDNKKHAGYSLKGKIANVYEMTNSEVLKNKEISEIMSICDLKFGDSSKFKFKEIAICTDNDLDGCHIFVMIINFFIKYFPELIKKKKIVRYLSPIIGISKGKNKKFFYDIVDWKKIQHKYINWKYEYYKGLGSLDDQEYTEMINNPTKIIVSLDDEYKESIDMAFNHKRTDDRKKWLMEDK